MGKVSLIIWICITLVAYLKGRYDGHRKLLTEGGKQ